ncbi:MAG TPA: cytochrome c [Cyclobacteriaceae bacterium]
MNKPVLALTYIIFAVALVAFQKKAFDLKASIARGKDVYTTYCISCHMEQGEGLESVYPPLAKSDYLMADKKRSIDQILHGVTGEIKVKGVVYNSDMPAVDITDQEVSDVLNYVRNSFGNKGDAVTPEQVKALRK